MKEKLQDNQKKKALAQIEQAGALDKLNDVRVNFLGKKGKTDSSIKEHEGCCSGGASGIWSARK